ncbi:MAG: type II toxin-antitoxin system VapC family toxin [Acidobacteriota bacterium]|nr:type II toxin-antitoxin system VapC family toxin [Acidobacteriota bacterium]
MTEYLLDTNTCIEIIRGSNAAVLHFFRQAIGSRDKLVLSSVVEFELVYGVTNSDRSRRDENFARLNIFLSYPFERLPFSTEDGVKAAEIRAYLKRLGTPIGAYDLLIAGQAVANGFAVVTDNVKEFSRVANLKWLNWNTIL